MPAVVKTALCGLLAVGVFVVTAATPAKTVGQPQPPHVITPTVVAPAAASVPTSNLYTAPLNVHKTAQTYTAPAPSVAATPTPAAEPTAAPVQQPGYVEFCPDGTPAQGSCETPEGAKGSNICYHPKTEEEAVTTYANIYCWAVTTKANPAGGYDYFCNYLYRDGTQNYGVFMGTQPDTTQGMACKP